MIPYDDCVLLQEKFGCPQCKGIFHAGTQQKIGELTTDESGNQKPGKGYAGGATRPLVGRRGRLLLEFDSFKPRNGSLKSFKLKNQ